MPYKITKSNSVSKAQNIFNKYCNDLKAGKVKRPDGLAEDIEITPDTFKMTYAELPKDNIFYKCRRQLPKQWFINENGIALTFNGDYPEVLKDNSNTEKRRTDKEKQYKVSSATLCAFKRKKDGKEKPKTLMNFVIVAIVYASESNRTIYILDNEQQENVKTYGLEAFGVGNSGNENEEERVRGQRGLIVNGRELIKPEDMLDVHHTDGPDMLTPDYLQIMPHWLHEKCKLFTASVETAQEFEKLLRKTKECNDYICRAFLKEYMVFDLSKTINEDGKSDIYIQYDGINKKRNNQVNSKDYKYFKIVPIKEESEKVSLNIIKQMDLQYDNDRALKELDTNSGVYSGIRFDIPVNGDLESFYTIYASGDKEQYKRFIKKLKYNIENRRITYDKYMKLSVKKNQKIVLVPLKNKTCYIYITKDNIF